MPKVSLVSLVPLVILSLVSCVPSAEPPGVQKPAGKTDTETVTVKETASATPEPEPAELRYPLGAEPLTLDIQSAEDVISWLIISQCIEGLFEYRGDGTIEPTGATGFEVSDDGLVYTIALREDVAWTDGEPVVAQHYVDGVIRLLDPALEAGYAWLMYDIEGAEAYNASVSEDPATVGVRAVDDHTLEVRLATPAPYFETILPFSTFYPVRLDLIEQYGVRWTDPGNYVCNGPYLLDAWEHGDRLVLIKNPAHWNADQVAIETITMPVIGDRAGVLDGYEKGELHSTGEEGLPGEEMARILADPVLSQELRVLPRPGVSYLGLNTLRPPTDDRLVRKALASAIDRASYIEQVTGEPWRTPLTCTTPPNVMGHQSPGACGYAYDPEQARAFLAEAGYPGGEGFPALQVWSNQGAQNEAALEAVVGMWQETLGITAEARVFEYDLYLDYLDKCGQSETEMMACQYHAHLLGWVMDYGDPQNQLEVVFAPDSPFQYTGWQNERYEELMELAATEFDTARRGQYYQEADRILCQQEVAVIPLTDYAWVTLVKEGLTYEYPPFGDPAFKHWALP
jgi:oligopeptide transport system substrate-binding protein